MNILIPNQEGKISQPNKGDLTGNIWASWNMDFVSNPGTIRVSPQTQMLYSSLTSTAMIYPLQFVEGNFDTTTTDKRIWAIFNGAVYYSGTAANLATLTRDYSAPSPSNAISDAVEWNGNLIVSTTTNLAKLTAGTWDNTWWTGVGTLNQSALNADVPHPLGKGFNNLLLIGDYNSTYGASVYSVDTSNAVSTGASAKLILGFDYQVIWIRSSSNMIYVGCRNINGGRAKVFAWDGYSQNYNYDYKISGSECFAGVVHNEVPYTMNERGELLALTGSAFTQVACLPVFNRDYNITSSWSIPVAVSRNGMTVQDNRIHILLVATVTNSENTYLENQLSGVWCYDPEIGLFHRYSITKDTSGSYGSPQILKGGVLMTLDKAAGNLLIGASAYLADGVTPSTVVHGVFSVLNQETETTPKVGYFITPKISTQSVQENWQKAWLVIKKFVSADSKIKVKYRTYDKVYATWGQPQICTWSDTNTFVSSPAHTDLTVGDEIEIIQGEGSGLSAHISTLSGTNVIDIDETVTGASGTIRVRASNWIDCGTAMNVQEMEHFEIPLGVNSTWIQFKVLCFFTGKEEVKKLIIKSEHQLPIK